MPTEEASEVEALSPEWMESTNVSCSSSNDDEGSDQENAKQKPSFIWRHSAAKAADNLLRILQDIELDVTINEYVKTRLKDFEDVVDDPKDSCCCFE